MTRLSTNHRHAIAALGVSLLTCTLLALCLIAPALLLQRNYQGRIEQRSGQLARARADSTEQAALLEQLQRLQEALPEGEAFLEPRPPALAAADLQRRIQQLIDTHGGHTMSMLPLEAAVGTPFRRITVKVRMQATLSALQRTLYALEHERPRLYIERLQLAPVFANTSNRDATRLEASLDVSGYQDVSVQGS